MPGDKPLRWVGQSLENEADGEALARDANFSRSHFQRRFRQLTGETPSACRRRLLFERAAHQLSRTAKRVTEIAFETGFSSVEGFSRGFRGAFGMAPAHFRRMAPLSWLLPAPNNIHYSPGIGAAIRTSDVRGDANTGETMDLIDRLLGHDLWYTQKLLESAATLTDAQLDRPLVNPQQPLPFEPPDETLRIILNRLVVGKEAWVVAILGETWQDDAAPTPASMQKRWLVAAEKFKAVAQRIQTENLWDTQFVDMSCDPPETFTYGFVLSHVVTWSAVRRANALHAMQQLGVKDLGFGDPGDWPDAPARGM
jgi:AraC family transcriptional regulator